MAEFDRCSDIHCNDNPVRLFYCAHHCNKLVCLHHLIEHDQLVEREREEFKICQNELRRFSSIYSTLVDEEKLRLEYEQKLHDHRQILYEINQCLQEDSKKIEHVRNIVDQLKRFVHEKQKPINDCPTIVKVEPIDESMVLTTRTSTEAIKDELISIGFDRLENLKIDTDYHRRKEKISNRIKSEDSMSSHESIGSHELFDQTNGLLCPFWTDGAYGISQRNHGIRLCNRNQYRDLTNHIKRFHGLSSSIANIVTKAVRSKMSTSKDYFSSLMNIVDLQRNFRCPMIKQCQFHCYLPAGHLKAHLIDVHHMNHTTAALKINNHVLLSRNKSQIKQRNVERQVIRQVKLALKEEQDKH